MYSGELIAGTCVTNGKGYAAIESEPLQKIFDLMVSLRSGDEKLLEKITRTFLSEGRIFVPKAGISVEGYLGGTNGVLFVIPVGSSKGYYVLRECLSNCE